MKRLLFLLTLIFLASFTAYSQTQCPPDMVCITPEAARKALTDADTVKAQALEIKALEQAVKDAQDNTHKMAIEFARVSGENTVLKQNAVSDRAIIEILLKSAKPKRIGLINIF